MKVSRRKGPVGIVVESGGQADDRAGGVAEELMTDLDRKGPAQALDLSSRHLRDECRATIGGERQAGVVIVPDGLDEFCW